MINVFRVTDISKKRGDADVIDLSKLLSVYEPL